MTSIRSPEWVKRQREKGRDILVVEETKKEVEACGKCLAVQGYVARHPIARSRVGSFYQWWEVAASIKWSARREGLIPLRQHSSNCVREAALSQIVE